MEVFASNVIAPGDEPVTLSGGGQAYGERGSRSMRRACDVGASQWEESRTSGAGGAEPFLVRRWQTIPSVTLPCLSGWGETQIGASLLSTGGDWV